MEDNTRIVVFQVRPCPQPPDRDEAKATVAVDKTVVHETSHAKSFLWNQCIVHSAIQPALLCGRWYACCLLENDMQCYVEV